MPFLDNPDYHIVEFGVPKVVRGGFVMYGYTYKPGLAEDHAKALRRMGFASKVTHDSRMHILWVKQTTVGERPKVLPVAVKRFKIRPVRDKHGIVPGFFVVSAGKVGSTFHPEIRVVGREHAQEIVDARHRTMLRKSKQIGAYRRGKKS